MHDRIKPRSEVYCFGLGLALTSILYNEKSLAQKFCLDGHHILVIISTLKKATFSRGTIEWNIWGTIVTSRFDLF